MRKCVYRLVGAVGMSLLTFVSSGGWADDARIQVINVFGPGLDREDAQAISDRVSNVARAEMKLSQRMKVGIGTTHLEAVVFADEHTTPRANFSGGETWPLEVGTFVSESDNAEGSKVAVIGWPVRDRLFGTSSKPLGEQIFVSGIGLRVIGVLGAHPPFVEDLVPDLGGDWDEGKLATTLANRVYVPFSIGNLILPPTAKDDVLIRIWVKDQTSIEATRNDVRQVLEQRTDRPVMLQMVTYPPGSLRTADESIGDGT